MESGVLYRRAYTPSYRLKTAAHTSTLRCLSLHVALRHFFFLLFNVFPPPPFYRW